MSKANGRGRPQGAKNITDVAEVVPSRCVCGSSERTEYTNTDYRDYSGAGLPFIGIYYRSCRCSDCGQARRDQEKVYAPENNNRKPIIFPPTDPIEPVTNNVS